MELYLMSPPGPRWALRGRANFRSAAAPPVDARAALAEWLALADAIEARGGRVACLVPPEDTALTGLPYAAECGQIVRNGLFLPNMKPEHRRGERALWAEAARRMGLGVSDQVQGTWEGQGDVALFRGRTLLFYGGRTTREGALSFSAWAELEPLFVEVREPAFHGNMALLPLPAADRVLVCPEVLVGDSLARLESAFGRERLLPVSEAEIRAYATNGLPVGRDVLVPHLTPPRVRGLLEGLGLGVVELRMTELCEKAGGASRCLVSHATVDAARIRLPPELDYRARRAELLGRAAAEG